MEWSPGIRGREAGKGSHIAPSTRVAAGEAQRGGLWKHREVLRNNNKETNNKNLVFEDPDKWKQASDCQVRTPDSFSLESESEGHSVMSHSLQPHGLYSPWNSPGQNTEVGNLFLLQGIFSTQGLNPGLRHSRQILCQLSHQGSPRIPGYPFLLFFGKFQNGRWRG